MLWSMDSPEDIVEAAAQGAVVAVTEAGGSLVMLSAKSGQRVAAVDRVHADATPAFAGDRVVFRDAGGHIAAVDVAAARVVWRTRERMATSIGIAANREVVIVGSDEFGYRGFDAANGSELWRRTPLTAGLRVRDPAQTPTWVASGRPGAAVAVFGVGPDTVAGFVDEVGGGVAQQLVAYDAFTLVPMWSSPSVCCDGYRGGSQVIVVDDGADAVSYRALSVADGALVWTVRPSLPGGLELRQVLTPDAVLLSVFRSID